MSSCRRAVSKHLASLARTTSASVLATAVRPRSAPLCAAGAPAAMAVAMRHCTSSQMTPEMITVESIEVEFVDDGDDEHHDTHGDCQQATGSSGGITATNVGMDCSSEAQTSGVAGFGATSASAAAGGPSAREDRWQRELDGAHYWDVVALDPFARSRVTNFVRRAGSTAAPVFQVREETVGGVRVCVASCHLRLPEPHRSYVAEGVADSAKDAELLAAMHAERVCDALGVPLFRLASMQRRHAEAARAEGRYSPFPGDPVRPEGTPVPPPLRMVAGFPTRGPLSAESSTPAEGGARDANSTYTSEHGAWAAGNGASTTLGGSHRSHQSIGGAMAEAEIITPAAGNTSPAGGSSNAETAADSLFGTVVTQAGAGGTSPPLASHLHNLSPTDDAGVPNAQLWMPWADPQQRQPQSSRSGGTVAQAVPPLSSTPLPAVAAEAAAFDPTENGLWLMVNTVSTRCSPTPRDALVLPCVYEPTALDRVKDYFLQHGLSLKDRTAVTTVAVPGSPTRMFVVELRLVAGVSAISARGKGQSREVATVLAAMHAELLLDALGLPLFPGDAERQARHARAAAGFGRWAPNPLISGGSTNPNPHASLPLPLKQQVGGDEVWLDPAMMAKSNAYTRSDGERIIGAMNDLNFYCGDCVEVNPPEEWLTEAVTVLRQWQVNVARNPFPELYVITVMGDYYRATTLTPVPREFGVRGGNAIGRTVTQAVQLCAMHAIDSLCALGMPLYTDNGEQERFMQRRRQLGLVTADDMKGMLRPKGLVGVLKPSIIQPAAAATPDAEAAMGTTRAYLPGYLIEGNATRLPPHIHDTLAILQLAIPDDFAVCGGATDDVTTRSGSSSSAAAPGWGGANATAVTETAAGTVSQSLTDMLLNMGNDTKTCVQNYLRVQHDLRRSRELSATTSGSGEERHPRSGEEEDSASLRRWLAKQPAYVLPAVYITGYGKQVSVHNIAYLRLPPPLKGMSVGSGSAIGEGKRKRKKNKRAGAESPSTGGADGLADLATPSPPPPTAGDDACTDLGGVPNVQNADDTASILAVGISLKKKDAERACYIHAAALLKHHYNEDVLVKYRAGLPRQGSVASFDQVSEKLLPPAYLPAKRSGKPVMDAPPPQPKPLMSVLMKQFMESGKHYTQPRKRAAPGPYSPF